MKLFITLLQKDLLLSFRSPLIYILSALYSLLLGLLFYQNLLLYQSNSIPLTISVLSPMFGNQNFLFFLLMPIISMNSFCEEKGRGTLTLLLTSPVTHFQIIASKYLHLIICSIFILAFSFVIPITLILCGYNNWSYIISGYLGVTLNIMFFSSIGLFFSCLNSSQMLAAMSTFAFLFLLLLLHQAPNFASNYLIGNILAYGGVITHFEGFTRGVIHTHSLVYYLTGIFLFLFLTKKYFTIRDF